MNGYNGPLKQALTSGTGFDSIGENYGENNFYGTFDGDNKAICSLYINMKSNERARAGLFSTCYGEIRNLGLVDANITAQGELTTAVGGLTGVSYNNMYNCYVTGNITATGSSSMPVGGLCGVMQEKANIENCYNLANITATNIQEEIGVADIGCGGIVGQGQVNINKCYNKGNIIINGGNNNISIGGICGHIITGFIKNSFNSAKIDIISSSVTETNDGITVAGIAGVSRVNITNCYNYGDISGKGVGSLTIGGISAAQANNTKISNVYNIGKINIKDNPKNLIIGGIVGMEDGSSISDAYNTGKINDEYGSSQYLGSIIGRKFSSNILSGCYYLVGTYDVGVGGSGSSAGVKEVDNIDKSVLDVVNGENAFKADSNNINNGYPILEWQ